MGMRLGPGAMVAAAFIGPGTVTTASLAGASTGLTLLWAVGFSVIATLVLQELSLRTALATNRDLSTLARDFGAGRWWGLALPALIVVAIGVGNAAYQSGNLSGAGLGLSNTLPVSFVQVVLASALLAAILIAANRYRALEQVLVLLVVVMAVVFVTLAVVLAPQAIAQHADHAASGAVTPINLILALIGTTVVPYNLFLHAAAVNQRWRGEPADVAIRGARQESLLAILIGGIITAAIMVVAAALIPTQGDQPILEALILAVEEQLPGLGTLAVGIGLFAAGLTSAITAPLAAGWAVCGALGWSTEPDGRGFRLVALSVLLIGAGFAVLSTRPAALIITAQVTNALLLPIIALLLVLMANSRLVPARFRNPPWENGLAGIVLCVVLGLALIKLYRLFW